MLELLEQYQKDITKISAVYDKATGEEDDDNPLGGISRGYLNHSFARCLVMAYHKTFGTPMRTILLNLLRTLPDVFTEEFSAMSLQDSSAWLTSIVMGEPHLLVEIDEPEDDKLYYCQLTANVAGIKQSFTNGDEEGHAWYEDDERIILCLYSRQYGYLIFNELFVSISDDRVVSRTLFEIVKEV